MPQKLQIKKELYKKGLRVYQFKDRSKTKINKRDFEEELMAHNKWDHLESVGFVVPSAQDRRNRAIKQHTYEDDTLWSKKEAEGLILLNLPMLIGKALELAAGIYVPDPRFQTSEKLQEQIQNQKPDTTILKFLIELGLGKAVSKIEMSGDNKQVINLFIPDNSRNDVTETIRKSLPPAPAPALHLQDNGDEDYEIIDVEFDAHDS